MPLQRWIVVTITLAILDACALPDASALGAPPCRIEVVDKQNGWPVPLVELKTTHELTLITDNAGVIAVDQPELLDREVWFAISGHGYSVPKDGFGHRGVRLTPKAGQMLRVEVERTNVAKRLGRLTGGGLFAESQKCGDYPDWRESGVFGCDTVQTSLYRGKCYWLWGDTDLPSYALGVFDSSSATTAPRPLTSFEPPIQVHYDYFVNKKGVPRGVAKMPGEGPTWISAYVTLPDRDKRPRLVGTYFKVHSPLDIYATGLCAWNDEHETFELVRTIWERSEKTPKRPLLPNGHPAIWKDANGREWLLLGNPFPNFRCPATFEAWQDSSTWEPLTPAKSLRSAAGNEDVHPAAGSIAWSGFRKKWVTVFEQVFGKPAAFGELWYAEADSPTGPWGPAVKVLSHDNYTFYNPRLHQEFTDENSLILLFEGTYTTEFADKPAPTQRYNYNQILYRLDLDDPALAPAHADRPSRQ